MRAGGRRPCHASNGHCQDATMDAGQLESLRLQVNATPPPSHLPLALAVPQRRPGSLRKISAVGEPRPEGSGAKRRGRSWPVGERVGWLQPAARSCGNVRNWSTHPRVKSSEGGTGSQLHAEGGAGRKGTGRRWWAGWGAGRGPGILGPDVKEEEDDAKREEEEEGVGWRSGEDVGGADERRRTEATRRRVFLSR